MHPSIQRTCFALAVICGVQSMPQNTNRSAAGIRRLLWNLKLSEVAKLSQTLNSLRSTTSASRISVLRDELKDDSELRLLFGALAGQQPAVTNSEVENDSLTQLLRVIAGEELVVKELGNGNGQEFVKTANGPLVDSTRQAVAFQPQPRGAVDLVVLCQLLESFGTTADECASIGTPAPSGGEDLATVLGGLGGVDPRGELVVPGPDPINPPTQPTGTAAAVVAGPAGAGRGSCPPPPPRSVASWSATSPSVPPLADCQWTEAKGQQLSIWQNLGPSICEGPLDLSACRSLCEVTAQCVAVHFCAACSDHSCRLLSELPGGPSGLSLGSQYDFVDFHRLNDKASCN